MKYTLIALLTTSLPALAVTTFTESFDDSNESWDSSVRGIAATHVSTGGADGGGYITNAVDFSTSSVGDNVVGIRAETTVSNVGGIPSFSVASGGNFSGNWIEDNVSTFSVSVRHNATVPLDYFARFARGISSFPGDLTVNSVSVNPNTWTELTFTISEDQFNAAEGADFATVFSDIGNIQIGVDVPAGLAGADGPITFDIDSASVVVVDSVPEPSTSLLALLGLGFLARRKRA